MRHLRKHLFYSYKTNYIYIYICMNSKKQKITIYEYFIYMVSFIYSKIIHDKGNKCKVIPIKHPAIKNDFGYLKKKEEAFTLYDFDYYNLIKNIRNCKVLSKHELLYVESLSKNNLIEIIKINNDVIKLFNNVLADNVLEDQIF